MPTSYKMFTYKLRLVNLFSVFLAVILLATFGTTYVYILDKSYDLALVKKIKSVSALSVSTIETGIAYGKPINNFYTVVDIIAPIKNSITKAKNVQVLSLDGEVLYSLDDKLDENYKHIIEKIDFDELLQDSITSVISSDNTFELMAIRNRERTTIAYLSVVISNTAINKEYDNHRDNIIVALVLSIILAVFLKHMTYYDINYYIYNSWFQSKDNFMKLMLYNVAIIVIPFTIFSLNYCSSKLNNEYMSNVKSLSKVVQAKINNIVSTGVPYSDLEGVKEWLHSLDPSEDIISNVSVEINTLNYSSKLDAKNSTNTLYFWLLPDANNGKAELILKMTYKWIFFVMGLLIFITITVLSLTWLGAVKFFDKYLYKLTDGK